MSTGIGPKRKLVQWLSTLLLLAIPFLKPGGQSLLRLDAPTRTLLFFGAQIRIEEFFLVLLVALLLVFGFLLVTMCFGRVWCGWFCPQTTLSDIAQWLDARLAAVPGKLPPLVLRHAGYLCLSFLVAANLIWYFIAPQEFVGRLLAGRLGPVAEITLAITLVLVYLDLALVRRSFCKTVCPYGRIQLLTMDGNTLTLEFAPETAAHCVNCGACRRVCPMGIDIRKGLQIECINCGRCLDACRQVQAGQHEAGLIRYSFGAAPHRGSALNRRSVLMTLFVAVIAIVLAFGVAGRHEATVKVERGASAQVRRLPDGSLVNFYTAYLENRSSRDRLFALALDAHPGLRSELVGQVADLPLAANANRRVDFALKLTPAPKAPCRLTLRLTRDGVRVAESPLPVLLR